MNLNRRTILKLPLLGAAASAVIEQGVSASLAKPKKLPGLLQFGVMGDSGSGNADQMRVAARMHERHAESPWKFVVALGDNVYEDGEAKYFESKFIDVYHDLLSANVPIRSTLGNHDVRYRGGREQVLEEGFGYIDQQDQYEFAAGPKTADGKDLARFICLNSNRWIEAVDAGGRELAMIQDELREQLRRVDRYRWNIVYLHHPIHSHVKSTFGISRGHGATEQLQHGLERLLSEHGVDLVMTGHDHFYQKIKPVQGVHHLISGAAGKLRGGVKTKHKAIEHGAREFHFMDMSLDEDALHYQAIGDDGSLVHAGRIDKPDAAKRSAAA